MLRRVTNDAAPETRRAKIVSIRNVKPGDELTFGTVAGPGRRLPQIGSLTAIEGASCIGCGLFGDKLYSKRVVTSFPQ